jgi:hypothetical protein
MAEEAKLLPPLDDRRRFRSLWKELLFARALAAAIAGAHFEILMLMRLPGLSIQMDMPVFAFFVALPSAVAKRGWKVLPITVALVTCAGAVVYVALGYPHVGKGLSARLLDRAILAAVFAAVGVAEGLLERSIATTWCGLFGGALSGVASAECWFWGLNRWQPEFLSLDPRVLFMAASLAIAHLGVGLSLALGRWIRDIPKRGRTSPDAR